MKELLVLVKKDLLTDYPLLTSPSAALKDKKLRNKALLQPLAWAIMAFYLWMFSKPILSLYDAYKAIGQPGGFLALGFLSFIMILIFFTVPYILSKIYFSRDVETLMSLPIRKENILRSKLLAISFSTLFFGVITVIPVMIKYGIEEKSGILYYLYGLMGILFVSLSIITMLSFILILIMKWVGKLPKAKNILQFLGLFFVLALSIGVNIFFQSQINYENPDATLDLVAKGSQGLINKILPAFPQVKALLYAMENSTTLQGFLYFALSLVLSVALIYLLTKLASPLMISSVLESKSVGQRKKARGAKGNNKVRPVWIRILQKELSDIFRTPLYAFNVLSGGIIFPLILILPNYLRSGQSMNHLLEVARGVWSYLPLDRVQYVLGGIAIGLVLGMFMGSIGSPNTTTFSREGKNIWLMQTLPIRGIEQLLGRVGSGLIIQMIILTPVLLLVLLIKPPAPFYLGLLLGSLLSGIFVSMLGLMIDVVKPKLNWDNPQEAMKQNFNVFLGMVLSWGYLALIGFILYKRMDRILAGDILLPALIIILSQLIIPAVLAVVFVKSYNKLLLRMN